MCLPHAPESKMYTLTSHLSFRGAPFRACLLPCRTKYFITKLILLSPPWTHPIDTAYPAGHLLSSSIYHCATHLPCHHSRETWIIDADAMLPEDLFRQPQGTFQVAAESSQQLPNDTWELMLLKEERFLTVLT